MSDKHPNRYPKHAGDKGQLHAGECNRTACKRHGATWWNVSTHGFYCITCAAGINQAGDRICYPIGRKPTIAEMNARSYTADIAALSSEFRDARRASFKARAEGALS